MTRGMVSNLVLLAVVLGFGWLSVDRFYFGPIRDLQPKIELAKSQTLRYEQNTPNTAAINRARRTLLASTLASTPDELEHRLRTRLSGLAEDASLREVVVTHGSPTPVMSPVLEARIRVRAFKAPFRSEPDFYQIRGQVEGVGSADEVGAALASFQSQPWIHRIESVKLVPIGKQRRVLRLELGFTVLFLPGASLPVDHNPETQPPSERTLAYASSLHSRPVFRVPDPVQKPQAIARVEITPPAPIVETPPETFWRVTGLVTAPSPEVWLMDQRNAATLILTPGQVHLGATVLEIMPDALLLENDGTPFRVPLGATLAERVPWTPEEPSP